MRFYILTQDYDSHWYVIPKDKELAWSQYLYRLGEYIRQEAWEHGEDEPELPEWADAVGGSPSLVRFEEYVID